MAGGLAANVVGSQQIKNGSVKAVDIKKDALTGAVIKESSLDASKLPRGPVGSPGAPGAQGYTMFMASISGSCAPDAYGAITGTTSCSTTEGPTQLAVPGSGTFDAMVASTQSPSNNHRPILRVNGVSTALGCITTGPACTTEAAPVHVNAGDLVSLRFECTTTNVCGFALTAARALVSLRFTPD